MNKNALKSYAPRARRDFIAAVTARAAKFGVSPQKLEPIRVEGDFAIIGGTPFPRKAAEQRRLLEKRISAIGFAQVMEAAAYTWFNRFAAIRYMEIHGYLDHGYRVLSHPAGKSLPEIVEQADHVDLPGLDRNKVVELKLDGRKDEDLYRILLIAQCNALHAAMPFLFERIDDETELLLPDKLLHTDSLIRQLVAEIDEGDWKEIEIIGWLYQFYIAERKDEVIGEVVKSEDIPAATQLFTPNWIVKYMVQNSLGAKWLATYPNSVLRAKMEYYIEPAAQTVEVGRRLAKITPTELDPEKLTMIDPACGSGHILVEGYDVLKEIYLERGYTLRQIPRLIIEKNLFGLDIDDRAAQLAGFALLMKARADDRNILSADIPPRLNVLAIQESSGLDADAIAHALLSTRRIDLVPTNDLLPETLAQPVLSAREQQPVTHTVIKNLISLFATGKTLGSLIQTSSEITAALPAIRSLLSKETAEDILESSALAYAVMNLTPLLRQAELLGRQYDAVVANPPYMGMGGMNPSLKLFVQDRYAAGKQDLYSAFILRCSGLCDASGLVGMITMHSWMFIQRYEALRNWMIEERTVLSLVHLGTRAFEEITGEVVQSAAFILRQSLVGGFKSTFVRLVDSDEKKKAFFEKNNYYNVVSDDYFKKIPTTVFSYWASERERELLCNGHYLRELLEAREGMATGSNDTFLREWYEVNLNSIAFDSSVGSVSASRWYPYHKGGGFRKWYGNTHLVVDWQDDGKRIKAFADPITGRIRSHNYNGEYAFREGLSWSAFSSDSISVRYSPIGYLFDSKGVMGFSDDALYQVIGLLNSKVGSRFLNLLSPTLDFKIGHILSVPILRPMPRSVEIEKNCKELIGIATTDWNEQESDWDFKRLSFLASPLKKPTFAKTFAAWAGHCDSNIARMKALEEENNTIFIAAYDLGDGLTPEVSESDIALIRADVVSEVKRLISYAIGCMMGRFSLVEPGLINAQSGGGAVEPIRYGAFQPDDDGIIPILDADWFADDVSTRLLEFLRIVWSPETLHENLKFIAEGLGAKSGETPLDTIRRCLSREFFKDHLQTYNNRPIYWLFSSGKEKAFECLVYLHRYNAGTLSRMRMEYVVPLQGRMRGKIEQIDAAIKDAPSTAAQTKLRKEIEKLKKKQAELVKFDEELRHFADQRIEIDLDDGVKVNYAKFGNLLSEVKKISGDSDE